MSAPGRFTYGETTVSVRREGDGTLRVTLPDEAESTVRARVVSGGILVGDDGEAVLARAVRDGQTVWVRFRGRTYRLEVDGGRRRRRGGGPGGLASPMPGQVLQHLVEPGSEVEAGTPLLVIEAMKMQLEIKAPAAGRVVRFLAEVGDQVPSGADLVELETA